MSRLRIKSLRFLLGFHLPVVAIALLTGLLSLNSFADLPEGHLRASPQPEHDTQRIAAIAGINQQMGRSQIEVGSMLQKAASGQANEAQMYRFHAAVLRRLSVLQQAMAGIADEVAYNLPLMQAGRNFGNDKSNVIMATSLAAVDPDSAMRHALAAMQGLVMMAEQSPSIANTIAVEMAERSKAHAQSFEQHSVQTGLTGIVVMALLLLWLYVSQRVTRRLSRLVPALRGFALDDIEPRLLAQVCQLSGQQNRCCVTWRCRCWLFGKASLQERRRNVIWGNA